MYDPVAGRFLSKDPIGYRGSRWGVYNFVSNSPLGYLDPWGLQEVSNDDLIDSFFPPPTAYVPEIPTPPSKPPYFELPKLPDTLHVITGTCQGVLNRLRERHRSGQAIHPALKKALDCNANIFCSRGCRGGLIGAAYTTGPTGWPHICLDSRQLNGAAANEIESVIIHESIHVKQMIDGDACACKERPWPFRFNPPIPQVGFGDCDLCKEREREAYNASAEHVYPSHLPGAQEFYAAYIRWGVCVSCSGICDDMGPRCPPRPEVPFPL